MKHVHDITAAVRRVILCCTSRRQQKLSLKISSPTDVRRVDICIPGLSEEHQTFLLKKAATDASRIFSGEPPSPFSQPYTHCNNLVPNLHPHPHPHPSMKSIWDHTRKLSASHPYGYHSVHSDGRDGSKPMLREQKRNGRGGDLDEQGINGGCESRDDVTLTGSGSEGEVEKAERAAGLVGPVRV